MNLLRKEYGSDYYETVTAVYKCTKLNELLEFIQDNRYSIDNLDIHMNSRQEGKEIYIIHILDCTVLRSITIKTVR